MEQRDQPVDLGEATVAVVMRTKDRPALLRRAIDDVLAQTYEDWVLMVVNDGGPPEPVDQVLAAVAGSSAGRIGVLHNRHSLGRWGAANAGIRATRSPYLVLHDDDDGWDTEFLSRTVTYLESSSDSGVMVRTEIVYERPDGGHFHEVGRALFWADTRAITLFEMLRINRAVPISFLYRREVHDQIGYYDESLPTVGDWEFHLRFLQTLSIGFLDGKPLAFWRQRPDSVGPLGNSVLAESDTHQLSDLLVRERYLKQDVQQHGLGSLLYLTKLEDGATRAMERRADHIDRALREILSTTQELRTRVELLEGAVGDASLVALARRRYRRLKGRFSRSR